MNNEKRQIKEMLKHDEIEKEKAEHLIKGCKIVKDLEDIRFNRY